MDLTNNPDVGYITADISSHSPAAIFVRTIPPSGFNDSAVVDPMLNGDVIIEPDIEKCGASIDCYHVSSTNGEYDLSSANFIKRIYSTIDESIHEWIYCDYDETDDSPVLLSGNQYALEDIVAELYSEEDVNCECIVCNGVEYRDDNIGELISSAMNGTPAKWYFIVS